MTRDLCLISQSALTEGDDRRLTRCGAEATAGANRGRNFRRKRGLAPDPTGGSAAAGLPGDPPTSLR